MKNPYLVLREKEQEIAHVRLEIAALITVIPLLWDVESTSDGFAFHLGSSSENIAASGRNETTDALMYHPFVETLLKDELSLACTQTANEKQERQLKDVTTS